MKTQRFLRTAGSSLAAWRAVHPLPRTRHIGRIRFAKVNVRRTDTALLFAALLLSCGTLRAEVTLPLGGYCRTGRYMPVRVDPGDFTFQADGSIPTLVHARSASVVPVLIGPTSSRMTTGSLRPPVELHPLADDEKLVGVTAGATSDYALLLFSSGHVLSLPLDATEPLAGPPAAWQALDGVVLTPAALAKFDDLRRSALLAEGITLAVDTTDKPDDGWPWIRHGPLWILEARPIGAVDSLVNADAFGPIDVVPAGLSPHDRRTLATATLLLAGLLIAARFVSRPLRYLLGVTGVTIAFALFWRQARPPVRTGQGVILTRQADALRRRDTWLFEIGRGGTAHSIPWSGFTRPVLPSQPAILQSELKLVCDEAMRFEYRTVPGHAVAFVKSEVTPEPLPPPDGTASPMERLAKDLYVQPGMSIVGSRHAETGWPSVLMDDRR